MNEINKEQLVEVEEKNELGIMAVQEDVWYDFTPITNIVGAEMKYRKLSNQNKVEIYVNGSNDTDIPGSINVGQLPAELIPSEWQLVYGIIGLTVNGQYVTKIQILNIGDDGEVSFSGGYTGSYVINSFVFYGVIDL